MKIKYGVFLNRKIEYGDDWDDMPIGAHISVVRQDRENAQTAGFEYYYKENGKTFIVKNPTAAEKFLAKATRKTGKKVVGYRKESEYVEDTTELKKRLESLNAEQEIELEFE